MKLTQIIFRETSYRQFQYFWLLSRKRKVPSTLAESVLTANNIKIEDAQDILRPQLQEE